MGPCRSSTSRRGGWAPWSLLVGLLLALWGSPVPAQEAGRAIVKRGPIAEDLYAAGGTVDILAEVDGDVVVAGGRVTVGQLVRGDVSAAGGEVSVGGRVLDDARVVGGRVGIQAGIGGDLLAAGGSVTLGPGAVVDGKAWLAGGHVEILGRIRGWLRAAGGGIRVAGEIDGDVKLAAREIEILPTARIAGNLTYRSPRPARIDPAARIGGTITHHPIDVTGAARTVRAIGWVARALLVAGLALAATALVLVFPEAAMQTARTIGSDPWKSLGVGFALLVSTPVAAALLMVTVLGLPLGLALLALYAVFLLVGLLVAAAFLGDLGPRLLRRQAAGGLRLLSAIAGVVLLGLLGAIPVAGPALLVLALLLGLGASAVHGYRIYLGTSPPAAR